MGSDKTEVKDVWMDGNGHLGSHLLRAIQDERASTAHMMSTALLTRISHGLSPDRKRFQNSVYPSI